MNRVKARRAPRKAADPHDFGCRCELCGPVRDYAIFPGADPDPATWEALMRLLACRSHGICEGCGEPFVPGKREQSLHHRRPRRMGGTDDPCIHGLANLMLLCGGKIAGVQGCHGDTESWRRAAGASGLLVPSGSYVGVGEPPEIATPVQLYSLGKRPSGRLVLLDPLSPSYIVVQPAA